VKSIKFTNLLLFIFLVNVNSQTENTLAVEEKIYGLSQLWKEASYNFAFFNQVPDLNWDSCYQAYIPKILETKNDWEYYLELQKFISQLGSIGNHGYWSRNFLMENSLILRYCPAILDIYKRIIL
jgi:hypothetical protein